MSESVPVVSNSDYSIIHDVVGLSASRYLISYYHSGVLTNATSGGDQINAGGPLFVQAVSYSAGVDLIYLISSPEVLNSTSPAFYIVGSKIDNSSAVFVFTDQSVDYGLRAVLASTDPSSGAVSYGSSLDLTRGQALAPSSSAVMDLDVVAVPPSSTACGGSSKICNKNSFTVLYGDVTNSGAMTMVSGKVSNLFVR